MNGNKEFGIKGRGGRWHAKRLIPPYFTLFHSKFCLSSLILNPFFSKFPKIMFHLPSISDIFLLIFFFNLPKTVHSGHFTLTESAAADNELVGDPTVECEETSWLYLKDAIGMRIKYR